jgi:hypothetical protein
LTVNRRSSGLEGCVDELGRRLGVDPGHITIKVVAKMFRQIMVRHDTDAMVSDLLDFVPADDRLWSHMAGKRNPVGCLLSEVDRRISQSPATDPQDDVAARVHDEIAARDKELADRVVGNVNGKGYANIPDIARGVGLDGADGYNAVLHILPSLVAAGRIVESGFHAYTPVR